MKTTKSICLGLLLIAVLMLPMAYSRPSSDPTGELKVLEMKSVPDGHYLLNLQQGGRERWVNLEIKSDVAKCVNSSEPGLKGLEGKFQLIGNGAFTIFLKNENHRASQLWLFRKDGGATVKEVPDRGEKQSADPVSGDSLERPPKPN